MTILGPVLMAVLMVAPVLISTLSDKEYKIAVVDETMHFYPLLEDANRTIFTHLPVEVDEALVLMHEGSFDAVLHIPSQAIEQPSSIRLISEKASNLNARMYIQSSFRHELERIKLEESGIDPELLAAMDVRVSIQAVRIGSDGSQKADFTEISMGIGFIGGFLIYIFIFLFGSQVLRGVMEEKTSRIVEIIVSSIRPFQLMMGKIVGVGLVGLTQFVIWIVLTLAIVGTVQTVFPDVFKSASNNQVLAGAEQMPGASEMTSQIENLQADESALANILEGLSSFNFPMIILSFLFFFLAGYLMYAALFAAIGSAVDNEADTQQFMLPITVPLLLALIMAQMVMNNPNGPVAFWMSMIPLTSPVIMMVRIPFGVPAWELMLSATLLIAGFILATWLAGKIYRTGILMYGKKPSYAELWKWIRQA